MLKSILAFTSLIVNKKHRPLLSFYLRAPPETLRINAEERDGPDPSLHLIMQICYYENER